MKIKKIALFTLVLGVLLFSSVSAFAQTTVDLSKSTPIAEVNIQGAKIANQVGNVINISFVLTNRTGVQTGVKYGVRLVPKDKPQMAVDERVYDESLTLAENSTTARSIAYTIPEGLSGEYGVYLLSSKASGFPFGISSAGNVTIAPSQKGVELLPESCGITIGSDKKIYPVSQPVSVSSDEELRITCTAVNKAATDVALIPSVVTYERSLYGAKADVASQSAAPVVLKGNEKKAFSLTLPKAAKPQSYVAVLNLELGKQATNNIAIAYTVSGVSATIMNVSADKDYYKSDDTAKLTLIWNGNTSAKAEAKIASAQGMTCGTATMHDIAKGKQVIEVPLYKTCFDPTITMSLKDVAGNTLDTKIFAVQTTSVKAPFGIFGTMKGAILLVLIALVVILIAIYMKRKGMHTKTLISILVFALALTLPIARVHADTYQAGPNNELLVTVNIDNQSNPGSLTYRQGDVMFVSGVLRNNTSVHQTVSLDAITIGNTSVNLFPSSIFPNPLVLQPFGAQQGDTQLFTINVPSAGTYNVDFKAGVDENTQSCGMVTVIPYTYANGTDAPDAVGNGLFFPVTTPNNIVTFTEIGNHFPATQNNPVCIKEGTIPGGSITTTLAVYAEVANQTGTNNIPGGTITVYDDAGHAQCKGLTGVQTYMFDGVTLNGSNQLRIAVDNRDGLLCN